MRLERQGCGRAILFVFMGLLVLAATFRWGEVFINMRSSSKTTALLTALLTFLMIWPAGLPAQGRQAKPATPSLATLATRELTADQAILHALNRLGFGPRPGDLERVRQMGLDPYIEQQLNPSS